MRGGAGNRRRVLAPTQAYADRGYATKPTPHRLIKHLTEVVNIIFPFRVFYLVPRCWLPVHLFPYSAHAYDYMICGKEPKHPFEKRLFGFVEPSK